MSDERPIFARWRYPFAEIEGKKILIVEFFEARHWRVRQGMDVFPSPKEWDGVREIDWSILYRLRINGRWFGPRRWSFFTMIEAARIVTRILGDRKIADRQLLEMEADRDGDPRSIVPAAWFLKNGPGKRYS